MKQPKDTEDLPTIPTGSVARSLRILAAVTEASEPSVQVSSLARELGLSNSTTHRMLRILTEEGWIRQSCTDQSYGLGGTFYRLAAQAIEKMSLTDLARPYIKSIVKEFDETTLLSVYLPGESSMTFVAREDGTHPLQYRISMNKPMSLVWGASGRVILAYLPEETAKSILTIEDSSPASGNPPPTWEELQISLAEIRENQYALSYGEKLPGARGVSAPVFDANGILGSLVITGPYNRMTKNRETDLISMVTSAAKELSKTLYGENTRKEYFDA